MGESQDTRDLLALAESYLDTRRCPGGRIVMKGYVCAHCGHDYTEDGRCKKPRRKARAPSPSSPAAGRGG